MRKATAVLLLLAGLVHADTVTVTVTRTLPGHRPEIAPLRSDCVPREKWSTSFNPGLYQGSVLISSKVTGFVDDACQLGTKLINVQACRPESFTDVDVTTNINSDGSFDIKVYDWTDDGTNENGYMFEGYNAITFRVTNSPPPEVNDTNLEEQVCESAYDCSGNEIDKVCWNVSAGCSTCNSHGSPQSTFGIANFNVRIKDSPIWHQTAVGAPLDLRMRFSNFGEAETNRTFGPKWSCNWNSSVIEINPGTNRLVFPSGSITLMALSTNGAFLPPDALDGSLVKTGGVYRYEKPDGWSWEYSPASAATNLYLLSAVRDAWSNTLSVTYTNDRLYRVTQSVPNSGRYLEFAYSGTNGRAISVSTEPTAYRAAVFNYSPAGLLTNVVDMGGYTYSYEYTNGYLARVLKGATERLAVTYSATPNAWTATNSYWVQLADAGGFARKFTWEYGAVKEEVTRGGTNKLENFYTVSTAGSRGRVLAGISKSGVQQQFQYTSQGRVSNRVDKSGGTWQQGYNALNRRTSMTDPMGHTRTYAYDSNGVDLLYETPPIGPVQRVMTYVPGKHAVATESNALGRVITYSYNSLGLVTNSYDGRVTETFSYDAEGRLTSRSRNGMSIETNVYDAFGRLEWTRDAAGLEVTRSYDSLNRPLTQTFDNNGQVSVSSNQYDCCALSQVTDRRGGIFNFQFNDIGEKQWESNPKGLTTYYAYGLEGQPLAISNALEWTTRQYTPEGWLKRVEYPARAFDGSHAENFWYDNEGRQTKRQTISGAYFKEEYDALDRKTGSYVPDGSTVAYGEEAYVQAETNRYDALGRLVWTRDIRGLTVSNSYNALGQVTRKDYPDASFESWTFDSWGASTSYRDRGGNTVSNVYDSVGRLSRQIDARGSSTFYSYTDADYVSSVSNATLGYVWAFTYDEEGRVTRTDYPNGLVDERSYDPMGNATQIVRAGITTVLSYDLLNNRTALTTSGALVESNSFDGLGRLLVSQNADGVAVTNILDTWGAVNSRYWPLGLSESFQYGDRGLTNQVDRLSIPTRLVRDSLGRSLQTVDGATNATSFAFLTNGVDQLHYLWDGNSNRTAWAYDVFGNPATKTYADSSTETYTFDALNRVTNKMDTAGVNTAYGYDANGNILSLKYGAFSPITFGYDALNRRTNMVDTLGSTAWGYDAAGKIISESGPLNASAATCSYDLLGRIDSISFGGYTWSYGYDELGRITSIGGAEGAYTLMYFQNGAKKQLVTYPGSVRAEYGYDLLGRLTNLSYLVPTGALQTIKYGYDAGDRRTNETWASNRRVDYGYDRAHQLTSSVSTNQSSDNASFVYDKAGNPLCQNTLGLGRTNSFNNLNQFVSGVFTGGGLTVVGEVNYAAGTVTVNNATAKLYGVTFEATNISVSLGSNLLTAVYRGPAFTNSQMTATDKVSVVLANTAYGYDGNGNLTNDGDFVYQYDLANRLTGAVSKANGSTFFVARYDALGRRREVVRNGTNTERYVYVPGTWLVLAVTDGTNGIKEVYTHGPDLSGTLGGAGGIGGIMGVRKGAASTFLHADALGNIVLATATNKPVATFQYGPFGKLVAQTGTFDSRFKYSSKEYDAQAGLLYYGYRSYSPALGRWLSTDLIGEKGGINLYGFVGNCVFNQVDFWGLEVVPGGGFWDAFTRSRFMQNDKDTLIFDEDVTEDLKNEFHARGKEKLGDVVKRTIDCPAGNPIIAVKKRENDSFQFGRKLGSGGLLDANFWRVAQADLKFLLNYRLTPCRDSTGDCVTKGEVQFEVTLDDTFDYVPDWKKKDLKYNVGAIVFNGMPLLPGFFPGTGMLASKPDVQAKWSDSMYIEIKLDAACCESGH